MMWFRLYHGTVSDPKLGSVARRSGETKERCLFVWVALLESASESEPRGLFRIDAEGIADLLNCDTDAIQNVLRAMTVVGMIDGQRIVAWKRRQPDRDDSAARMRDKRKRDATSASHARHGDAEVTPPDTDTDTDSESEIKNTPSGSTTTASSVTVASEIDAAVELWNDTAGRLMVSKVQVLTPERRRKLASRLKMCGGLDGWRAALAKVEVSSFLNGTAPRTTGHENWAVSFDFLLQNKSFVKLMEGNFDDGPQARGRQSATAALDRLIAQSAQAGRA